MKKIIQDLMYFKLLSRAFMHMNALIKFYKLHSRAFMHMNALIKFFKFSKLETFLMHL